MLSLKAKLLWGNLGLFLVIPFIIGLIVQYTDPNWFFGPLVVLLGLFETALLCAPFVIAFSGFDK